MSTVIGTSTEYVVVQADKISTITPANETNTVTLVSESNILIEGDSSTLVVSPGSQGPPGISEENMVYAKQTDFVGEDVIYKGEADPGSPTSSPVWRIHKLVILNDDVSETWAGGNANFDKIWDNRASLLYP